VTAPDAPMSAVMITKLKSPSILLPYNVRA
jgi:hypothetical protein